MTDIRKLLQEAEEPSKELNEEVCKAINASNFDYTSAINLIEEQGIDWIMGNVNGQIGGTPYACVGVPEDKASYAVTPLLSLWLSYFRLILGDEREVRVE